MITKEDFKELSTIFLNSSEEDLVGISRRKVADLFIFYQAMNKAQNIMQVNPAMAVLTALSIARIACGADGEIQEKEKALVEEVLGDIFKEVPSIMEGISLEEVLMAPLQEQELDTIYGLCRVHVRVCADIVTLILAFIAADGKIDETENYLVEELLPAVADRYEFMELLKEIKE